MLNPSTCRFGKLTINLRPIGLVLGLRPPLLTLLSTRASFPPRLPLATPLLGPWYKHGLLNVKMLIHAPQSVDVREISVTSP